jgi:hypothetical protein
MQVTNLPMIRPDLGTVALRCYQGVHQQRADHREAERDLLLYRRDLADLDCLYGTVPSEPHHLITYT